MAEPCPFFCDGCPTDAAGSRGLSRTRNYQKRGGEVLRIEFDEAWMGSTEGGGDLVVALDDALQELAKFDARKSQVVEMRFFAGLSAAETAEVLKVSEDTVLRSELG